MRKIFKEATHNEVRVRHRFISFGQALAEQAPRRGELNGPGIGKAEHAEETTGGSAIACRRAERAR